MPSVKGDGLEILISRDCSVSSPTHTDSTAELLCFKVDMYSRFFSSSLVINSTPHSDLVN